MCPCRHNQELEQDSVIMITFVYQYDGVSSALQGVCPCRHNQELEQDSVIMQEEQRKLQREANRL